MKVLLNLGRNKSFDSQLNVVVQKNNIFLMDNHLAALWCWLQKINPSSQYNLFHIDRHYDLFVGNEKEIVSKLRKNGSDLSQIPLADLTKIKYSKNDLTLQCFTWDNYFPIMTELYPHLLNVVYFATHRKGSNAWSQKYFEKEIYALPENLCYWMEDETEKTGVKWIVNVDIDYFFIDYPYKEEYEDNEFSHYQFLSDIYVRNIAEEIRRASKFIEVLTIALSPECCGGWDNAIRIGKMFTKQLGLRFPKI